MPLSFGKGAFPYRVKLFIQVKLKDMSLYEKAFKILQTDSFDRKRYMAAIKLYQKAEGQEKYDIGQLFEGQLAMADRKDVNWVASISHLLD